MKNKRIAIIPARGQSKRIPRKNIKLFCGRPIILRLLDEVNESGLFDEIHISTEDEEIAQIVTNAGFPPKFKRRSELSGDNVALKDVLKEVVNEYQKLGETFDVLALLFATAVSLDRHILKEAVEQFENGDRSAQLISIARFPVPVEWAMRMDNNKNLSPLDELSLASRSQDLAEAWYETGDFVLYNEHSILENNTNSKKRGFVMPDQSIDIDTIQDWKFAEYIYSFKNNNTH